MYIITKIFFFLPDETDYATTPRPDDSRTVPTTTSESPIEGRKPTTSVKPDLNLTTTESPTTPSSILTTIITTIKDWTTTPYPYLNITSSVRPTVTPSDSREETTTPQVNITSTTSTTTVSPPSSQPPSHERPIPCYTPTELQEIIRNLTSQLTTPKPVEEEEIEIDSTRKYLLFFCSLTH